MSQYGSPTNTKEDYQKMTRRYALENLQLTRDCQLLKDALRKEEKQNERYREELERLKATITNQANRIADKSGQYSYMGAAEYRGTKQAD
jgi:DNA anti-recombination protein RmuC